MVVKNEAVQLASPLQADLPGELHSFPTLQTMKTPWQLISLTKTGWAAFILYYGLGDSPRLPNSNLRTQLMTGGLRQHIMSLLEQRPQGA